MCKPVCITKKLVAVNLADTNQDREAKASQGRSLPAVLSQSCVRVGKGEIEVQEKSRYELRQLLDFSWLANASVLTIPLTSPSS